jgi:membrane protein required for colicin V production
LSSVDIVLSIILLIGAFGGYRKGFLQELFSLVAIILGVLAGFKLMGKAMILLAEHYTINDKVLPYVAFAVVFLLVVIVVSLLGKMLKSSMEKTALGSIDQVLGGALGILRTAFMLSVILWIAHSLNIERTNDWSQDSWLYPVIAKFAPAFTQWVGEIFPVFGDLFN